MTPEQLSAVERLYHEASSRPREEWDAFLVRACPGDEAVRREVRLLLDVNSSSALIGGRKLGPYEITGEIGKGGMGEVYKAQDTRLHRTVAIKVLPRHGNHDPELRQRLEREARAIAALNHPNICTLYD